MVLKDQHHLRTYWRCKLWALSYSRPTELVTMGRAQDLWFNNPLKFENHLSQGTAASTWFSMMALQLGIQGPRRSGSNLLLLPYRYARHSSITHSTFLHFTFLPPSFCKLRTFFPRCLCYDTQWPLEALFEKHCIETQVPWSNWKFLLPPLWSKTIYTSQCPSLFLLFNTVIFVPHFPWA